MGNLLAAKEICFLNRIGLYTQESPLEADPQEILSYFFDLEQPTVISRRLLKYCCAAAANPEVALPESPTKVVGFFQKLEILMEICYLLYNQPPEDKPTSTVEKKFTSGILTPNEISQPYNVFKEFFRYKSLGEWKLLSESWCDSAISRYSIADNINADEVLLSFILWWKLIDASWLLFTGKKSNQFEEPPAYYGCTKLVA